MRVALYLRCSTTKQDLESQRQALIQWAQKKEAEYDLFEDYAFSGMKAERPGIDALLLNIKKYSYVAVVEVSRLGRSIKRVYELVEAFAAENVKVVLVNSGTVINNESLEGRALLGGLALAADIEWLLIKERNQRARAKMQAMGIKGGRKAKPISPQALRALLEKGVSLRRVALDFQVSPSTIKRNIIKLGIQIKKTTTIISTA